MLAMLITKSIRLVAMFGKRWNGSGCRDIHPELPNCCDIHYIRKVVRLKLGHYADAL